MKGAKQMVRQIIHIDEEKCNGCGLCANACHEGAIGIVDGKAKLLRDDYCDGMGDCLPHCPQDAITFENREAADYDRQAVEKHIKERQEKAAARVFGTAEGGLKMAENQAPAGCPGSRVRVMNRAEEASDEQKQMTGQAPVQEKSQLQNWPVQLKLAPTHAPYFDGAKLLVAADCTAYAYARFHQDFIKGRVCLIGCSKLDDMDYTEKLTEIIRDNDIKSVTIVRMEVPCCGGIEFFTKNALQASGKFIPWQVYTIGIEGEILDE